MGRVNLVSPDGRVVSVDQSAVKDLTFLGYRPESFQEGVEREEERAIRERHGGEGSQVMAAVEGGLAGLTFGVSDIVLDDEATRTRAQLYPKTRFAGELVGAIAPAFLSGGATAGASGASLGRAATSLIPAVAAARAGGSVAGRLGGRLVGSMAGAGLEGALAGAGYEMSRSELSGDPLTVEGALGGVGLGLVFGLGGGAVAHGLGKIASGGVKIEDDVAAAVSGQRGNQMTGDWLSGKRARVEPPPANPWPTAKSAVEASEQAVEGAMPASKWSAVHANFNDVRTVAKKLLTEVDEAHKATLSITPEELAGQYMQAGASVLEAGQKAGLKKAVNNLRTSYRWVKDAVTKKAWEKLDRRLTNYRMHIQMLADQTGASVVLPKGAAEAAKSLEGVAQLHRAVDYLDIPNGAHGFFKKSRDSAEKYFAALGEALSTNAPEAAPVQDALRRAVDDLATQMGVVVDGGPVDKLRASWQLGHDIQAKASEDYLRAKMAKPTKTVYDIGDSARETKGATKTKTKKEPPPKPTKHGKVRESLERAAAVAAMGQMVPGFGWKGALVTALMSARAATMAKIAGAARKWAPDIGKAVRGAAPRVPALSESLAGYLDDEGSLRDRLKRRSMEVRSLLAGAQNAAFATAQEFTAAGHPEFAKGQYDAGTRALFALASRVPVNPVGTNWGMESMWESPDEQVHVFAQQWEAATNPADFIENALNHPADIFPEAVEVLQEAWPGLYDYARAQVLVNLSEGGIDGISENDLSGLSVFTGIAFHPTMAPEFIMAQQEQFLSKPAEPVKQGAAPPPGSSEPPTSAQRRAM